MPNFSDPISIPSSSSIQKAQILIIHPCAFSSLFPKEGFFILCGMTIVDDNNQMIYANQLDHHPKDLELINSPTRVKHEKIDRERMDMDVPHSLPEREQLDSQNISSGEIEYPEPLSEEEAYSPPVNSEIVPSEPVSSEMVYSHTDIVHSLTDPEELFHSESVNSEPVYSQPSNSDFYSQPVSSDLAYSQPVYSDFVHSQPVNPDHETVQELMLHSHENEPLNSPIIGMELETVPQPLNTEIHDPLQATPDSQPGNRRKKKSIVWEHFTIETVSPGCRRACCKVCNQSFAYSTGSKFIGTSHLKRHIAKGACPTILHQQEKDQLSLYLPKSGETRTRTRTDSVPQPRKRYRSSSSQYLMFDQDKCRHEIARMVIMHNYPLHMIEHPGFVAFVKNLQPCFDMVSFNIVHGDCLATFLDEKQKLRRFVEGIPGRICLTLDMWTSNQSAGYVFVSGQFIDSDWNLHRRLLNVVMEPFPESDSAFSRAVVTCLSDWSLDRKLASITFNRPLSETGLEKLQALLAVKNPLLFNGQLLIRDCIAHTLSSMAQEVLNTCRETVNNIRSSVKYVKTTESREEKFLELKQQLQIPSENNLSLDNVTKWNTTLEMLVAACELKQVFSCLDSVDPNYTESPSTEDWKEIENVCMFLNLLHATANLLTTKTVLSSHLFFHEVWKIQLELARAGANDDPFVSGMSKVLLDKLHKYLENSCLILAIGVVMDPRFKMKLVEFSFTKIFTDEAPHYIRVVDEGMHELFHEYTTLAAYREDGDGVKVKVEDQNLVTSNGLSDFDMYIMETTSQKMKSELDQYLEESLLPRVNDFDVIGWWKLNKIKYPTLSIMARDILSIPMLSVPPESVYNIVTKEMDSYKCSLPPETVEALICAKDWLQQTTPAVLTEVEVKMEI